MSAVLENQKAAGVIRALILIGVLWMHFSFVPKSDFDAYKAERDKADAVDRKDRADKLQEISVTLGRLDERLKGIKQ